MKLHPSSDSLTEYVDFIHKINSNIKVLQKKNIFGLITNCDVVITFPLTTVTTISMLCNKPVIVYNFLNIKDDNFIKEKIGFKCTEISKIIYLVKQIMTKPINKLNQERYIIKYYYKIDGKSSERIALSILKKLND